MKPKSIILVSTLTLRLFTACSTIQSDNFQITNTPRPSQPMTDQPAEIIIPSLTAPATTLPSSSMPKPPLEKNAWMDLPVIPANVYDSMREVYELRLAMSNDPKRFSVIGDCQNASSYFLSTFDKPGDFRLGEYAVLQPTVEYYQGSFSRTSLAVKGGFNAAAVLSPLRADPKSCNKGESPLDCELRIWKPSVVFVSMETWWYKKPEQEYDKYMRKVIERLLEAGVVPIIATKADNLEGDHSINATIAQIAYDYEIPLWNFWAAVQPLPDQGLTPNGFYLTFARNFFDDPARMERAWPWRNLTTLQAL
ncbi:MAG TPA: hypothetical protein VLA72_18830 [Anaerolineales bacterium]|nr:hypothetical protein [Anaerolineales bacterium]